MGSTFLMPLLVLTAMGKKAAKIIIKTVEVNPRPKRRMATGIQAKLGIGCSSVRRVLLYYPRIGSSPLKYPPRPPEGRPE